MKARFKFLYAVLVLLGSQIPSLVAATTVTQISVGEAHSMFVKSDGSLWVMGNNRSGEIGEGPGLDQTNVPQQLVASNVVAAAAGGIHSLFLKSDGTLWATGANFNGQLGDGTTTNHLIPEQIPVADFVTAIAAGNVHSLFRTTKTTGTFPHQTVTVKLLGMGGNHFGQLGDTTLIDRHSPIVMDTQSGPFVSSTPIACGQFHTLFIEFDSSLWATGDNAYGELGDGTTVNATQPKQIILNSVNAVAGGGDHTLFVKSDGGLWGMGFNAYGALGNGTNNQSNPVQVASNASTAPGSVAAGFLHSLFVGADGSLWAAGYNIFGQLGNGTTNDQHTWVKILSSNVVAVAAGDSHSLFVKSDGSLWAMGLDTFGQLGDGFTNFDSLVPEQIFPKPQPRFTSVKVAAKTNLQVSATCFLGGKYVLLTSTNLTQPVGQWAPVLTNSITARGTNNYVAILTNAVNSGVKQRFYVLQGQ